MNLRKWKGIDE